MAQKHLAEKMTDVTMAMEEKLQAWEKAHRPKYLSLIKKEEPVSDEVLEGLKALGDIQ